MGKRYTETNKWDDPWFRRLSQTDKLFWFYLLDKCDNCGMWQVDLELASFFVGGDVSNVLERLNKDAERVVVLDDSWLVKAFIDYQYVKLRTSCPPHLNVIRNLQRHGLTDILKEHSLTEHLPKTKRRVAHTPQEKEKEEEKEIDNKAFDDFYAQYPRKVAKPAAKKAWKSLNPSADDVDKMISALKHQKQSEQWQRDDGKFIPHPATWINQRRWEDEYESGESDVEAIRRIAREAKEREKSLS